MMKKEYFCLSIFLCVSAFATDQLSVQDKIMFDKYKTYQSDTSIVRPRFISLPVGAVQPYGWLKQRCDLALKGITGHLDEYSVVHKKGWLGEKVEAIGSNEDGTGWLLEQSAYWLDGAVRLAYMTNDNMLIRKVESRLDSIVQGVLNGGETFIYWKGADAVNNNFNSWAHSHIARALIAYYQATGKDKVLKALCKVYGTYNLPNFPEQFGQVSGWVNIDPMFQTYLLSGDQSVLRNIKHTITSEHYRKNIRLWNQSLFPIGHGVITYENIRIPEISYLISKDITHLTATYKYLEMLEKEHVLPFGIASSEEWVAGIGSTRNVETCNIACAPLSYQLAFEITGETAFGDKIEQIFFNAAPVGASYDYRNVIYYQSPNKVENVLPGEYPCAPMDISAKNDRVSSYEYSPIGHTVMCCVGNMTRVLPNYIMNMWMKTFNGGLAAMLYGPNILKTTVGKNSVPISITVETNYPFEEEIMLKLEPQYEVDFPLLLRIPSWAETFELEVNGKHVQYSKENGFVKVDRLWKKGDEVSLILPMEVRIYEGKETSYPDCDYHKCANEGLGRSLALKTDVKSKFQSVFYGPLLFALPLNELYLDKQVASESWDYALNIKNVKTDASVCRSKMPNWWDWDIDDCPLSITVKAKSFEWNPTPTQPLPDENIDSNVGKLIRLVPYGCTHYRISMFPIAN